MDFYLNILFVAALGGLFILHKTILNIKNEYLPLLSICSLSTILYCAALIGMLKATANLLWIVGMITFFSASVSARVRNYLQLKDDFFTSPPILFFFLTATLLIPHFAEVHVNWNDEFSRWALIPKLMHYLHTINLPKPYLVFDYPPGLAVFKYFSLRFQEYRESQLYFSSNLIYLACFVAFINFKELSKWPLALLILAIAVLLTSTFGLNLHMLMTDALLAVLTGTALYIYYTDEQRNIYLLLPIFIFIFLIKNYGLVLDLICLSIIVLSLTVKKILVGTHHAPQ